MINIAVNLENKSDQPDAQTPAEVFNLRAAGSALVTINLTSDPQSSVHKIYVFSNPRTAGYIVADYVEEVAGDPATASFGFKQLADVGIVSEYLSSFGLSPSIMKQLNFPVVMSEAGEIAQRALKTIAQRPHPL